jgi:NTE family protein
MNYSGLPDVAAAARSIRAAAGDQVAATRQLYPFAEINGRRYADGGAYSLYSADLAAGHDVVIVISPFPLAPHLRDRLDTELAALGDCASHIALADQASLSAIGADPTEATAQVPALGAGMIQAAREANPLRSVWDAT